jgi:hypothetical protein
VNVSGFQVGNRRAAHAQGGGQFLLGQVPLFPSRTERFPDLLPVFDLIEIRHNLYCAKLMKASSSYLKRYW